MNQTDQQVFIVVREWLANHAPSDFLDTPANGHALFNYVLEYLGEAVTIPNLIFAEQALRQAGKLQLAAPPPPPTAEEVAAAARKKAKEDAKNQIVEQQERWKREHYAAVNQKERDFAKEVREKMEADARAKEQADAEATLKLIISNYVCTHPRVPNKVDMAQTNQTRADLGKVEVRVNGKRCAIRTLQKVREILSKLP